MEHLLIVELQEEYERLSRDGFPRAGHRQQGR